MSPFNNNSIIFPYDLLNENKKQAKLWLDSIPSLDDMYELKSYDELEKIVNDWLNGSISIDKNYEF